MSADFINGIGSRSPGLREAYGLGARPAGPAGAAGAPESASPAAAPPGAAEGFAPTPEAGESRQDTQAGEARASQIFAAWSPTAAPPVPSAGQLQVQGAENTAVNQVHGVQGGQYSGSQGPESGFTGGTVYSSKPPGL